MPRGTLGFYRGKLDVCWGSLDVVRELGFHWGNLDVFWGGLGFLVGGSWDVSPGTS